jgi:glycosyltransferase involved in cell wall biosynthesis
MKGKRIIIAVSNDLASDQRAHRAAGSLVNQGASILLVGRKLPDSPPLQEREYAMQRMRLMFRKGPFFYASFNLRLFVFLIIRRANLVVSNDLDTLPACFLVAGIKGLPLVYDSHEYFTEVPELVGRPMVRRIWIWMEKRLLPRIRFASTVSRSVAEAYREQYGIRMRVIRNLPYGGGKEARRPDVLECGPKRIIVYQGALNMGRGLETMINSMQYLDDFLLHIFGDGDIRQKLVRLTRDMKLEDRVEFMGRKPFRELMGFTRQASLGISLEEDRGLNYRYALPNKLFDYIQAGVPVLVSNLPEMRKIVEEYGVGQVVRDPKPERLAEQIREMMGSDELRMTWKKNLRKAATELCWEREEEKWLTLCREALED